MENTENQQIDYNALLEYYIPRLHQFECRRGGEGEVFFIDDNFVVKREIMSTYLDTAKIFLQYCEEVQQLNKQGCNIPKFYAYKRIDSEHFKLSYFYILIERVKGEELAIRDIAKSYDLCKSFCTKDDFKTAMAGGNNELEAKIMKEFMAYALKNNLLLQDLPSSEIETFVDTVYMMRKAQHYSRPDVHSENVLINESSLKLIDPATIHPNWWKEEYDISTSLVKHAIRLFESGSSIIRCGKRVNACNIDKEELIKLKNLTLQASQKNLLRFIRYINKAYKPVINSKKAQMEIKSSIEENFGKASKGILNEIEMGV